MRTPVANASKARFGRMKNRLAKLNPDLDIESVLDPKLEYEENLRAVKKKYPQAVVKESEQERDDDEDTSEQMQTFRTALSDDYGISNKKLQSMIASTDPPLSTEEFGSIQFLVGGGRSLRAVAIDQAKQARDANDARDWAGHFNRSDIKTLDSKPKGYVPKYKLKKTNREEWKKRVEEDKRKYASGGFYG